MNITELPAIWEQKLNSTDREYLLTQACNGLPDEKGIVRKVVQSIFAQCVDESANLGKLLEPLSNNRCLADLLYHHIFGRLVFPTELWRFLVGMFSESIQAEFKDIARRTSDRAIDEYPNSKTPNVTFSMCRKHPRYSLARIELIKNFGEDCQQLIVAYEFLGFRGEDLRACAGLRFTDKRIKSITNVFEQRAAIALNSHTHVSV